MSEYELVKHYMREVPTAPLEMITRAWIEIVLERSRGNQTAACRALIISICKIRNWIEDKGVKSFDPIRGHPAKVKTMLRKGSKK
jgi:transcriptional regulator with PAS, ATPase and Fis domain